MRQRPPQMEVNWTAIICFILAIFLIVLMARTHDKIGAFLGTMERIGPGHSTDEQVIGLMAFGLVVITIVGLVTVLTQSRNKKE